MKFSSPDLLRLLQNLGTFFQLRDEFIRRNLDILGRRVSYTMRQEMAGNVVTGELSDSVGHNVSGLQVTVGPRLKAGRFDRGLILQRGTRRIPNVPFGPIRAWSQARNLPAGAVWMKIRKSGVEAYPFLDETLARGDTQVAIRNTARRLGFDIVAHAFQGLNKKGGGKAGAQFVGEAG